MNSDHMQLAQELKPTIDAFSEKYMFDMLTDDLRTELATSIDQRLTELGYGDRLVRVLEPRNNGDTVILVFIRDEDKLFRTLSITFRGIAPPKELAHD